MGESLGGVQARISPRRGGLDYNTSVHGPLSRVLAFCPNYPYVNYYPEPSRIFSVNRCKSSAFLPDFLSPLEANSNLRFSTVHDPKLVG